MVFIPTIYSYNLSIVQIIIIYIFYLNYFQVGATVWPTIAMINFCLIPPRNRVPFISLCSLVWTSFLAYMKHLEKNTATHKFDHKLEHKPLNLLHIQTKFNI